MLLTRKGGAFFPAPNKNGISGHVYDLANGEEVFVQPAPHPAGRIRLKSARTLGSVYHNCR